MNRNRLARVALWLALAVTADANRRHFRLGTAWVPHGVGNSIVLFLPELAARFLPPARTPPAPDTVAAIQATLRATTCDNPNYTLYVAPMVLGYAVSHPKFNIYKGGWARLRFLGFGLDAIPHSLTGATLSLLLGDTLVELARQLPAGSPLAPAARWGAAHPAAASAVALALASLIWEGGEYLVQQSELRARDYDLSRINMEWSLRDSLFDVLANYTGWAIANAIRQARSRSAVSWPGTTPGPESTA